MYALSIFVRETVFSRFPVIVTHDLLQNKLQHRMEVVSNLKQPIARKKVQVICWP